MPEFKIISNYLTDNKDVSRRVHIFTQQIFEQFLEMEAEGILSEVAGGSAVLLNIVRTFLQFTELDFVDLKLMQEVDCWDALTHILQTMLFQKIKKKNVYQTKTK
ncbi:hypothetical protein NQ318_015244 [Aromia moschata]|uniref:Uncharacterized protein n=1 Tax=Aromia moschata TaxID=1265417 RepID=A0AAV8YFQ4_9CUCU|nr:hypothetical protein NQ318_015244 [Aromia moschata]